MLLSLKLLYILPPVPQPTVSLANTSVAVGLTATLRCSVTLNQYASYSSGMVAVTLELVNMGTVRSTICASGTGATRTADFTITTTDMSEAGQYQCRATVNYTGTNMQFVEEPSTTISPDATLQCECIILTNVH